MATVNKISPPAHLSRPRAIASPRMPTAPAVDPVILSFDVEEHFLIEAAAGLEIGPAERASYRAGLGNSTRWLLEQLAQHQVKATFFVLGHLVDDYPSLIQAIHRAGHEIASHGWGHQRLQGLTPQGFREDVRRSKLALEDLTGQEVVGYRAPTFSIVRDTSWAVDVLADLGFLYDSSIYPVRHDRYGVPEAPRTPYLVEGRSGASLVELPPLTWKLPGINLPAAGGGYFRLFPPFVMEQALRQTQRLGPRSAAMLYFHPWEFDPGQPKLQLRRLNRFRTYVGIKSNRERFRSLLSRHQFTHAIGVARQLEAEREELDRFRLSA